MRDKILVFLFFVSGCFYAQAQDKGAAFRKQTPAETAFLNRFHKELFESLPHIFRNWKTAKEDTFDAAAYWCRDPVSWRDCTADIPKSVGHGDPYSLDWQVDFTMPDEESGPLMGVAIKSITDYNNGPQIAAALKGTNKFKLSIFIVANVSSEGAATFTLSYCGKTPPANIPLPVPATLALKGTRSVACPIKEDGRVSMHGDYYDRAVVFLGKPVIKKEQETRDDGLVETRYAIGFDRTKIGKLLVQNIVVTFKGDSADIDEAVKLINWNRLYALIDK